MYGAATVVEGKLQHLLKERIQRSPGGSGRLALGNHLAITQQVHLHVSGLGRNKKSVRVLFTLNFLLFVPGRTRAPPFTQSPRARTISTSSVFAALIDFNESWISPMLELATAWRLMICPGPRPSTKVDMRSSSSSKTEAAATADPAEARPYGDKGGIQLRNKKKRRWEK